MKTRVGILFLSCMLIFTTACKNQQAKKDGGFEFNSENLKKSDIEVTKSFIYMFPSPGVLLERFHESDLMYFPGLMNDPANSDTYLSSRDKGLNLGVYITDMAYAAIFERSSESVAYIDEIKKLSTELNVSTSIFEGLIDRAKENVGNNDSLVAISNEVFYNMIQFLEESGKESTIAIISCGAYIEAMYMVLHSVDEYDAENPVIQSITEMKYPMENLLGHTESNSDDPSVQSILNYVKELSALFAELDEESSSVTKSEPGVLTFSGGTPPELSEDNYSEMKALVNRIRESITLVN